MTRPWLKQYEPGVPHTLEIPEMTLSDMFDEAVKTSPEQAAMSLFGRKIRYGEFGRQVEQLAIALHRLGVKVGDRVAIMLPNIPQYPIAHFAILKIGAIVVPTNPMYVERELKHQLHDSGAETILTLDFLFPRV
ncbi:MAG: long-chain fatty acid--CoA ligase, partial [Calditrichaeota bacterium]